MASIRELKKEVNHLVVHIIEQAFQYQVINPSGKGYDDADKIIEEAVELRDNTVESMYAVDDMDTKQLKSHFSKLKEDFQKKSIDLIERLDKLPE